MKRISILLLAVGCFSVWARDIDLEQHVSKYWAKYHNMKIEIGDGDKRWPVTPELKAERLRHFRAMVMRFAPHIVAEYSRIDKVFKWKDGTFLGMARFGAKEVVTKPDARAEYHECTSWASMPDLNGNNTIFIHKNRDSKASSLTLLRRAVPGKHAWIGNGSQYSFHPTQGVNDRGVVVVMNSGDPQVEIDNSQYGMGTSLIARILLEECGSAEAAVELLKKIIMDKAYTHVECGSIWFIGDKDGVFVVEHGARKFVARKVEKGFVIRANAFHYPELVSSSLRNFKSLLGHYRREFAVRDFLINQQWRNNGVITPGDYAAASRINSFPDKSDSYPTCGKSTVSSTTFAIDREFPEVLTTAYMVFGPPRSACYLPVPLTVRDIPEDILNGKFSNRSLALHKDKKPLLPEKELAALEARLRERHAQAVNAARKLLRTSRKHTAYQDAAKILNDAFLANWQDVVAVIKEK